MAITYPLDLLDDFPGWSTDFSLLWRQEQSVHASGRIRVKDFGTPIWRATYQSKTLSPNNLDIWRAKLDSLENGLKTFKAYSTSRCRPIRYPGTSVIANATVNSIDSNRKKLSLENLAPNFELSVGDLLRINTTLHRVMENITSNGSGITLEFEIRPHLGVSVEEGDVVILQKPFVEMTIVPDSISTQSDLRTGRGSVSFQAIEARG